MSSSNRPLGVTGVAWLFIAVGAVGLVHHFPHAGSFHNEDIWIELTELLALIAGGSMLRRQNWARWLALAWMAFHVALSAFPPYEGLIVHIILFAGITWILLRSDSARYFRGAGDAAI